MMINKIRKAISYDPVSGSLFWNINRGGSAKAGTVAGTVNSKGYIVVGLFGKRYQAHRLAWFIYFGNWPVDQVDHVDGNKINNSIRNLREATNSENCRNRSIKSTNKAGYKGVSKLPSGRFSSEISSSGNRVYLGSFDTAEHAHAAYCRAAKLAHGVYANMGLQK